MSKSSKSSPVRLVQRTERFQGHILSVAVETLERADGRRYDREVVEHAETVTVVALDEQGRILLVRQYRRPADQELLETPAGGVDERESPMEAANRELAEEAGVSARRLEHLGSFYLAPGWCNEFMHAFLARDLVRHELEPDEDEEIEVVWLTPSEWEERLARGEILDGKSIAAWQLARLRLRQEGTVL